MSKKTYIIWMAVLAVLVAMLVPVAYWHGVAVFRPEEGPTYGVLLRYVWLVAGMLVYLLLYRWLHSRGGRSNLHWLETQSHELTHALVGALFGRKILRSEADADRGMVYSSSNTRFGELGLLPMTLAPYCLPVWAMILVLMRPIIVDEAKAVFDFIIGVVFGFQLVCFYKQTRGNQTDIQKYPLSFSYPYIYVMRTVNLLLIFFAFLPEADGMCLLRKLVYPFEHLGTQVWDAMVMYWHLMIK